MTALLTVLLFGTAFLASAWTLFASIRAQLPRMRELLRDAPAAARPAPVRVTPRRPAPAVRRPAPFPRRAAA